MRPLDEVNADLIAAEKMLSNLDPTSDSYSEVRDRLQELEVELFSLVDTELGRAAILTTKCAHSNVAWVSDLGICPECGGIFRAKLVVAGSKADLQLGPELLPSRSVLMEIAKTWAAEMDKPEPSTMGCD